MQVLVHDRPRALTGHFEQWRPLPQSRLERGFGACAGATVRRGPGPAAGDRWPSRIAAEAGSRLPSFGP